MSDLRFKGFPTNQEQRAYFEVLGLELRREGTGFEVWSHIGYEGWADNIVIRSGASGKCEIFVPALAGMIGKRVLYALDPAEAERQIGVEIRHTVMGNVEFLGFDLNHLGGTEIVEALRVLAKKQ